MDMKYVFICKTMRIAWCLLIFLIVGCNTQKNQYYPLESGMKWEYHVSIGGIDEHECTLTNVKNLKARAIDMLIQQQDCKGKQSFWAIQNTKDGLYKIAELPSLNAEPKMIDKPVLLIKQPLQIGTTWEEPYDSKFILQKANFTVKAKIKSMSETVTVPIGTFNNCMMVEYKGHIEQDQGEYMGKIILTIEKTIWYAPDVGMVKSVLQERSNVGMKNNGNEIIELVSTKRSK